MPTTQTSVSKTVLITGASSGIGRACALHLDAAGYHVFAGVRRDADGQALRAAASERLTPVSLDVTDAASIAAAREAIAQATGSALAGLVNNAGFALAGPIEFQPVADLRQQMEVNLVGAVAVTQAFIPQLRTARGRIVNIGSISGISATPFQGAYAATKFALEAISDALRVELRPWGISVSVVQPGDIATPAWQKALDAADRMLASWPPQAFALYGPVVGKMKEIAQQGAAGTPPEAVAQVVAGLLSARAPRARVLVGVDAKVLAVIERLPTRLRDWIIARQLPRYGGA
jgi:NAD(P)-dependent dehydrogenase (short-subunit alcohol dehydrogenase family)